MAVQIDTRKVHKNYRMTPRPSTVEMLPDVYRLNMRDYADAGRKAAECSSGKLTYSEFRRYFMDEFTFELPAFDTEIVDIAFFPLSCWDVRKADSDQYIECIQFALLVVK